jgi:hypothetical protein
MEEGRKERFPPGPDLNWHLPCIIKINISYNLQFPPLRTNMITKNQAQLVQSNQQIHQQIQPAHMFNVNTSQIFSTTQPSISNHRSGRTTALMCRPSILKDYSLCSVISFKKTHLMMAK